MREYEATVKLLYNGKLDDITFIIMAETYGEARDKVQKLIDPRIRVITGMEVLAV